jgi:hypothetical protein
MFERLLSIIFLASWRIFKCLYKQIMSEVNYIYLLLERNTWEYFDLFLYLICQPGPDFLVGYAR